MNAILFVGTSFPFLEIVQLRETATTINEQGSIDNGKFISCAGKTALLKGMSKQRYAAHKAMLHIPSGGFFSFKQEVKVLSKNN